MYRHRGRLLQVMLVHPGGPFWARKDDGAWSVPKGELTGDEEPLEAAIREFNEETGIAPTGPFEPLGSLRQPGGKTVTVWAFYGEWDPTALRSNTFAMEWPPGSGSKREFPEVDRAAWFDVSEARRKILPGQVRFIEEIEQHAAQESSFDVASRGQQTLF
jgi:predicted NUDIX family NTP pyrophosphohydrolase